jgi:hypothetical protein
LIVNEGSTSCEGAGTITEAQLHRSAVLHELCGSSVGTTTLALSMQAFTLWQAHADRAQALDVGPVNPLDAATIWQVCRLAHRLLSI